jgi:hypothetical protein
MLFINENAMISGCDVVGFMGDCYVAFLNEFMQQTKKNKTGHQFIYSMLSKTRGGLYWSMLKGKLTSVCLLVNAKLPLCHVWMQTYLLFLLMLFFALPLKFLHDVC